jgi:ribose transport system substrate-binding protein
MSTSRAWLWGILALALITVIVFRQSVYRQEPKPSRTNIALITGGSGPFWQLAINGAKAAAKQFNAQLEVLIPEKEEGLEDQMELLRSVDESKVDGLAISPLDAEAQTHPINALANSIDVVTFDADAPLSQRQYYIGTSNFRAGQLSAELITEALPEGGPIVVLYANKTKNNMIERAAGFQDYLDAHPNTKIKVVGTLIDEGDTEVCKANIRKAISEHPKLAGIVGMNAQHGPTVMEVLTEDGLLGKIKVAAFDEDERTLKGVEEGHIQGTVVQDPYNYGYEAVRKLVEVHRGGPERGPLFGKGEVNIQCGIVRKDDVDGFRKKLESRLKESKTDANTNVPTREAST